MAAEDSGNPSAQATNPILPHYPELILAAIDALDSKNGANKSRISRQIEASYGNLPAAHKTLLSHHLNKMKASGELVVIKNNYVKPDPNASPQRGRGRPAKPKEPVPEGAVTSPPRPRGRPRKSLEGSNSAPSPSVSGRKRGRPRKVNTHGDPTPSPAPATGEKRGRGRPPKEKTAAAPAATKAPLTGKKRGRGRPPKEKTAAALAASKAPATGEKRGRGRPPKVKTVAPVEG